MIADQTSRHASPKATSVSAGSAEPPLDVRSCCGTTVVHRARSVRRRRRRTHDGHRFGHEVPTPHEAADTYADPVNGRNWADRVVHARGAGAERSTWIDTCNKQGVRESMSPCT